MWAEHTWPLPNGGGDCTSPFLMDHRAFYFPEGPAALGSGGLFIGFCGIVLLMWPELSLGGATGRSTVLGILAVQIACAGWAVASAYTRRHALSRNVLGVAAVQMFFGGLFMTMAGSVTGEWAHLTFSSRTTGCGTPA